MITHHSCYVLQCPRVKFKEKATVQDSGFTSNTEIAGSKSIPHHDCGKKVFTRGDVLIVNDNLAHYRGELEIVLTEIPNDGERNLVATVKEEEMILLDFVTPGHHFVLKK